MWPSARIAALAADRKHGAAYLARRAVEILVEGAAEGENPLALARALAAARPAMGAIAGAVGRVTAAGQSADRIVQEGRALIASYERAPRSIAVLLAPQLRGSVRTHSRSATVREALEFAAASVVDEGYDAVLVGADAVFRDGSIVNATGTCGLAEAARRAGVPVLVAAETLKLVPTDPHKPDEEGFELVAADLIDRIATEEGLFAPEEIAALVDRTPFLCEGYTLVAPAAVA